MVSEFSKCGVGSLLPDAVGLTGKPSSVGSALSTMAISCVNHLYWSRVTVAALVHGGNPSVISNSEGKN